MASQQFVLIVSSDAREQRVLAVSLRKAGLDVRAVSSGRSALEVLDASPGSFGVAIVELNLDDIDGFELCERIRENGRLDAMALVALSGSRDLATKLRAFEHGFDELVTKPVYMKELSTRVELMLQRRAREQLALAEAEEIEGRLEDLSVVDLVQSLHDQRRTAIVHLEADDRLGELFVVEGELIDADSGALRGETAAYRLMRWTSGFYTVKYIDTVRRRQRIQRDTPSLVADGLERAEHYQALESRLPMGHVFEVDYDTIGAEINSMPPAVRALLSQFDGYLSLDQVVEQARVSDLEVLRLAERLIARRQLVAVERVARAEAAGLDEDIERSIEISAWLGDAAAAPASVDTGDREPSPAWSLEGRRELADTGRQLRDEQARVLTNIARHEAEAARATEDRVRRDIEARQRRHTGPTPSSAMAAARPLASLGHVAGSPRAEERPSPKSIRDQVVSALAEAEIAYRDRAAPEPQEHAAVEPAHEPAPVSGLDAWEAVVQDHASRYEVIATRQRLKPMTLVAEEDDEDDDLRRARRGLHPVLDGAAMGPGALSELPERGRARNPFGDLAGHGVRKLGPVRIERPEAEVDPEPRPTPAAEVIDIRQGLSERRRRDELARAEHEVDRTERGTAQESRRLDDHDHHDEPRLDVEARNALRQTKPGIKHGVLAAERARLQASRESDAAIESESRAAAVLGALRQGSSLRERRGDELDRPLGPMASEPESATAPADTSLDAHELDAPIADVDATSDPDEARSERETLADTPVAVAAAASKPAAEPEPFDDDFFAVEPARRSNPLSLIAVVLLAIIAVGAVVLVLQSGGDGDEVEDANAGEAVSANPAQPGDEASATSPDEAGTTPDETPAAAPTIDDPRLSPGWIDAEANGTALATLVADHSVATAELLAGVEPTTDAADPFGDAPVEPAPEPKVAAPKPEPAPAKKAAAAAPKKTDTVAKKTADDPPKADAPKKDVKIAKADAGGGGALAKGKAAFKKKKYKDAITELEKAVASGEGGAETHYMLGMSYSKTRQYQLALKHLEKARGARSGNAGYWKELGTVYIRLKNEKQGLDAYQKAVDLLGADHPDAQSMQAYIDSRK